EGLAALDPKLAKGMYMTKTQNHRHDLTQVIAGIVYESLASVANGFLGYNDDAWLYAHGIFDKLYPQFGDVPPGLDPIQQQVAIKLVAKLRDNMQGWYPAISRVLLAAIGPYEQKPESKVRTAFLILKDAVYTELQKLSGLHVDKPSKTGDFLPQNVTYDAVSDTLTHVYSGGSQQTTTLRDLTISEIDLFDEINWRFS
ncbi:MAG TPA: hypothetical protein VNF99_11050, partial [Stellaceae bacterium]|nr:hypothetical protein [Stellaceae bacterium]